MILSLIHKHLHTHRYTHTHAHYHTITRHLSVLHEEGIVLGYLDGEALGMEDKLADRGGSVLFAALDTRGVLIREPESVTVVMSSSANQKPSSDQ